jgi:hypothetical protein
MSEVCCCTSDLISLVTVVAAFASSPARASCLLLLAATSLAKQHKTLRQKHIAATSIPSFLRLPKMAGSSLNGGFWTIP